MAYGTQNLITVCESADDKVLTKFWVPFMPPANSGMPYMCRFVTLEIRDINHLHEVFTALARSPKHCLIRGSLRARLDPLAAHRRLSQGPHATIDDVASTILLLDCDIPQPGLPTEEAIRKCLPAWAKDVDCVVQLSASSGHPLVNGWKVHLAIFVDRALTAPEARALIKTTAPHLDASIYTAVAPFFTADPVMSGCTDPYQGRRIGLSIGTARVAAVPLIGEPLRARTDGQESEFDNLTDTEREHLQDWGEKRCDEIFSRVPPDGAGDYFRDAFLQIAPLVRVGVLNGDELLARVADLGRSPHALRSAQAAFDRLEMLPTNHALQELRQHRKFAGVAAQYRDFSSHSKEYSLWERIKSYVPPEVVTESEFKVLENTVSAAIAMEAARKEHAPVGFKPPQNALDLEKEDIPPVLPRVDNLLTTTGAVVFAGPPKIGKGFTTLDLATAIASGGYFMGNKCHPCDVLCFMLEDNKNRIRHRLDQLGYFARLRHAKNKVEFYYSDDEVPLLDPAGKGGILALIEERLRANPEIKVVTIDTIQRIRLGNATGHGENMYAADYRVIAPLQSFAAKHKICIFCVHHTKKGKVEDEIEAYSGSFGLIGAFDGGWVMKADRAAGVGKLTTNPRDLPEVVMDIMREKPSPVWRPVTIEIDGVGKELEGDEGTGPGKVARTRSQAAVLHALTAAGHELTPRDIAKRTALNENTVKTCLRRLIETDSAVLRDRGLYAAPGIRKSRVEGMKDTIRAVGPRKVTEAVITDRTGGRGAPDNAEYYMDTDDLLIVLDVFDDPKKCLDILTYRGICKWNKDTTWLLGPEWGVKSVFNNPPIPFAAPKTWPWEK